MGFYTRLLMIFNNKDVERIPAIVRAVSDDGNDLKIKRQVQTTIGNLTVVSITGDIVSNVVDGIMLFTGSNTPPGMVPHIGRTGIDAEVDLLLAFMRIDLSNIRFKRYRERHWYGEYDSHVMERIDQWVIANQPVNQTDEVRYIIYVGNNQQLAVSKRCREEGYKLVGEDYDLKTMIVDRCNGGNKIQVIMGPGSKGNQLLDALGLDGSEIQTSTILENSDALLKLINMIHIWEMSHD